MPTQATAYAVPGTDEKLFYFCLADPRTGGCRDQRSAAEPRIIVSTLNDTADFGTGCTSCIVDMIQHSDEYPGTTIWGTHTMPDEVLAVLFPGDQTPDTSAFTELASDCRQECLIRPPNERVIAAAIDSSGLSTVCTSCVVDMIQNPDYYGDLVLYGTHIIPEHILADIFPDDFRD